MQGKVKSLALTQLAGARHKGGALARRRRSCARRGRAVAVHQPGQLALLLRRLGPHAAHVQERQRICGARQAPFSDSHLLH